MKALPTSQFHATALVSAVNNVPYDEVLKSNYKSHLFDYVSVDTIATLMQPTETFPILVGRDWHSCNGFIKKKKKKNGV